MSARTHCLHCDEPIRLATQEEIRKAGLIARLAIEWIHDSGSWGCDDWIRFATPCNEQARAIARIRDAAPELLEALEAIALDCGLLASGASKRNDTVGVREFCALQKTAEAAIKKARGGQP